MREIEIEQPASKFAETRGWFEIKIMRASKKGFPDRLYIRAGRTIYVEYKAPKETPTHQQLKRHKEMRDHGAEVFVIDDLERAHELFK